MNGFKKHENKKKKQKKNTQKNDIKPIFLIREKDQILRNQI